MRIPILLLFLFTCASSSAQEFSLRLIVEDAMGHSDTVYYGRDSECTGLIDTEFGGVDLSDTPWDTTIDARFLVEYPSTVQTKRLCTREIAFNDCYQSSHVQLAVATEHWPITIHWDSAQTAGACEEFMGISCSDILWNGDYSCDNSVPFQIVDFRTTSSVLFETAIPNGEPCFAIESVPQHARFIFFKFKPQGVGIQEDDGLSSAHIWPNPTLGPLTITSTKPFLTVAVVDMLGRVLLSERGESSNSKAIDLTHLPAGIYVVHVETEAGRWAQRVVRE
jgi:hypothetical protein